MVPRAARSAYGAALLVADRQRPFHLGLCSGRCRLPRVGECFDVALRGCAELQELLHKPNSQPSVDVRDCSADDLDWTKLFSVRTILFCIAELDLEVSDQQRMRLGSLFLLGVENLERVEPDFNIAVHGTLFDGSSEPPQVYRQNLFVLTRQRDM